jgi:6,7-dimethyl-8-ribityllumazine synthase
MLKRVRSSKAKTKSQGGSFAIIASRYNRRYVDAMLNAARRCLQDAGIDDVRVIRVPGAYEIPVVATRLAWGDGHGDPLSAIICLGLILRGETTHAQHIGEAVTFALTLLQVQHGIPIIHEVLLLENEQQARVRCLSREHNRGTEAAQTALEMAAVMQNLA